MEATAARMAARDRYGAFGEAPASPLQRFIRTGISGDYRLHKHILT